MARRELRWLLVPWFEQHAETDGKMRVQRRRRRRRAQMQIRIAAAAAAQSAARDCNVTLHYIWILLLNVTRLKLAYLLSFHRTVAASASCVERASS